MAKTRRAEAVWIEARERWQINVQRDGKRKTFTSTIPGRKGKHDAEAKADDWLDAGQPDDMRFDAAWGIYLEHIQKTTGATNYKDIECIGRIWLMPNIGKKKLGNIRLSDIQTIVNDAVEKGKSARTCKNIKDKFFGFYTFAGDNKWKMDSMRSQRVKIPKKAPKAQRTIVQPEQLKLLFDVDTVVRRGRAKHEFYIHAFRILALTGMRRGELCGLTVNDYKDGVLYIRRSINQLGETTRGKNDNARRRIPLTKRAVHVLADQQEMIKEMGIDSKWLFPSENGSATNPPTLTNHWNRFAPHYGITSSLHELRHTFVSITENDIPDPLLKRVVGHSDSMDTHGIYGHALDNDLERALGMMENVFDRVLGE